ncbi:sugar ABC transporter ATP-binding protein [Treponema sp. HNW]|uniref:sugar ABC transporter ATP-binding protein n=1 Tax=Treponema sp. HNW TaxID=3116654 RepID=UPI003D0DC5DA
MSAIIELENVSKQFPGVTALDKVSFSIDSGEIHAIVGENGAGKSTLINILGGQYHATSGKIKFKGKEVYIKNQAASLAMGIGIVYQELKLCSNLTATENIFLGQERDQNGKQIPWSKLDMCAKGLIEKLGGKFSTSAKLQNLSLAEQQLVEIARALSRNAEVIIMDEPTSSLTIKESESLFEILQLLKTQGKTIIYISHRMEEVFALSNRISVLRDGKYLGTYAKDEIKPNQVISLIAGKEMAHDLEQRNIKNRSPEEKPILEIRAYSRQGIFNNLNLSLYPGEILGIYGLQGSGRTELLEAMFGLAQPTSGEMLYKGKSIQNKSTREAIRRGFAMVTENRLKDGFFSKMSILGNVCSVCSICKTDKSGLWLNIKRMTGYTDTVMKKLSVHASSQEQLISQLSGGNQQKVILGKWLTSKPAVLFVDEPTRGVDVGAKTEIFSILRKLSADGLPILLVSSELSEIIAQSNRILVMKEGAFVAEFNAKEVTKEKIIQAAI